MDTNSKRISEQLPLENRNRGCEGEKQSTVYLIITLYYLMFPNFFYYFNNDFVVFNVF